MAEGGGDSLLVSGSEPVFEFYCEFCNEEGLHIEAVGHCTQCQEYLCGSCVNNHKRNRLSRNHKVLDKDGMPKDTLPAPDRVRKDITTMCTQHKGEPVKYYCKSHDELACSSCFVTGHKACTDIVNIPDASKSIFNDKEYQDFIKNLKALENQIHDITEKSRDHSVKSKRCCSEAIEAVRQFRDDINSILDEIESSLKTQAANIKTRDLAKMGTIETTCSNAKKTIDTITAEFDSLQSTNRVCQAYIRMKETTIDVEAIKRQLTEAEDKNTIQTYTFLPNTKLTEFLNRTDILGLFSMEDKEQDTATVDLPQTTRESPTGNSDTVSTPQAASSSSRIQDTSPGPHVVSSASFVHDINVRSTSDSDACSITGQAVLSDSKLVIVDNNNCNVKLVDTHSMRIISELQVPWYKPWDVTVIKEDKVAVTVPGQNTILVLRVTGSITEVREITVNGPCYGIAYSKNQLVVTYSSPPKLEIMDLQGNVDSKIERDKDSNELFQLPYYVCVSSDGDTLYVSDYLADSVVSLSRSGVVNAIYTDNNLRGPEKVCLDHRGNVFVCGGDSYNIHMLTPECTKITEILTRTDGLTNYVYSVCHCRQTDRLYVGTGAYDKVKVYQLSIMIIIIPF